MVLTPRPVPVKVLDWLSSQSKRSSSSSGLSPLLQRHYDPTQDISNYKEDHSKGHEGHNEVIKQIKAKNTYEDLFPSVYLNGYDSHYHTKDCGYIKLKRKKVSLITAYSRHYTPCSKCNPPKIEKYAHLIKKNPPEITRKYIQKSSPVNRKKAKLNRCVDKDGQLIVTPHACSSLGLKRRILTNIDLPSSGGSFNIVSSAKSSSSKRIVTATSSDSKSNKLSLSSSGIDRRIGEYFRRANENVGALSCSVSKTKRHVSQALKNKVKARDGHKCAICGSTRKLEVDHIRALMNGGSNDMSNLATLCDDCHTKKTRMDNSLKRKRKKICGR